MEASLQGRLLVGLLATAFSYYTAWLFVTPFIEEGQPILRLFPRLEYALLLPAWLLVAAVCTLAGFVGLLCCKNGW